MFGTLGQVYFAKKAKQTRVFNDAFNLYRGPDDSGVVCMDRILFGHRRLSILDLDRHSRQPRISECENYIIVFNGEIYNYIELREGLKAKEVRFRTKSYTEILLKLFISEGVKCLSKLIEMFAFSIYNKKLKNVIIARDHLDIKSYCYNRGKPFGNPPKPHPAQKQKIPINSE